MTATTIAVLFLTAFALAGCNDKDAISFKEREVTVYLSDGEDFVLIYTPEVNIDTADGEYTLSAGNPTLASVTGNGKSLRLTREGSVMITATTSGGVSATMMLYIVQYRPATNPGEDHSGYWTVSFDTGGQGSLADQYIKNGGVIEDLTPLGGSAGYIFYKWYLDAECTQKFDPSTPITSDLTLYGFWAPGEPTFTYQMRNDSDNELIFVKGLSRPHLKYDEVVVPATNPEGQEIYGIYNAAFAENEYVTKFIVSEGIRYIGSSAFSGAKSLKEVVLPTTLEKIDESAFANCPELTAVTFADGTESLTEISARAFKDCPKLESVTLPDSVSALGESAFEGDAALTSFDIPDSLYVLQARLFYGSGLTSIDLEDRVTDVYNEAFRASENLETVTGYSKIRVMGSFVFGRNDENTMTKWLKEKRKENTFIYLGHILVYVAPATRIPDTEIDGSTRLIAGQAFQDVESGVVNFPFTKAELIPDYGTLAFGGTSSDPVPTVDLVVPINYEDIYVDKWLKPTTDSNGDTVPTTYSFNVIQNIYVESSLGNFELDPDGGKVPSLAADVYMRTPYKEIAEGVYFDKSKLKEEEKLSVGLTRDEDKVCYLFSRYQDDLDNLNLLDSVNNSPLSKGKTAYIDDILPFAFYCASSATDSGVLNLRQITLPNRISRIGYMAFSGLKNLSFVWFVGEEGLGTGFTPAEINELSFNHTSLDTGFTVMIEANYSLSGGTGGSTLYDKYLIAWEDILGESHLQASSEYQQ